MERLENEWFELHRLMVEGKQVNDSANTPIIARVEEEAFKQSEERIDAFFDKKRELVLYERKVKK